MNKKIKPNRYRPEAGETKDRKGDFEIGIDFCLKCMMIVAFISILSLTSIFTHDFITQSDFFNIKTIEVAGAKRVIKNEIIELAELTPEKNIFSLNLFSIEKLISSHPWIQSASVKRKLSSEIIISIIEQEPMAIVKIENLADILINTQGRPFKEYNPKKDQLENLPVISGLDLTSVNSRYIFDGPLFNSIMDYLQIDETEYLRRITGDNNTGITIETSDIYNRCMPEEFIIDQQKMIQIKLGFNQFKEKLTKAKKISEYIDKNFPDRTICSMDLFNIKKVFIKTEVGNTKVRNALHNNLEKGVYFAGK